MSAEVSGSDSAEITTVGAAEELEPCTQKTSALLAGTCPCQGTEGLDRAWKHARCPRVESWCCNRGRCHPRLDADKMC